MIGETQSGKTHWANQLHRTFTGDLSVFFNTNHAPYVWGTRVHSLGAMKRAVADGHLRLNYLPVRDQVGAQAQLEELKEYLFAKGGPGIGVWCQVVADEAQRFKPTGGREDPVEDIARRGLGAFGVRVVAITQYPTALNPGTRTNCSGRVIFKPGIEGDRFVQTYGSYPYAQIKAWTDQVVQTADGPKHRYFATYRADRSWQYHPPL